MPSNRFEEPDEFFEPPEDEGTTASKFNLESLIRNGRYVVAVALLVIAGAKIADTSKKVNYIYKPSNIANTEPTPEPTITPSPVPAETPSATPTPEPTATASPEPTVEPQPPHTLEIGIQEESIGWDPALAELVLTKGKEMGATVFRTIVHIDEFAAPDSAARVDLKVNMALQHGYNVQIAFNTARKDWSDESFSGYVSSIVNRYPAVNRFSIFNEPNQGTLRTMPGKTQAETARELYEVGEKTIHSIRPEAMVTAFDLGSKNYPLVYLREALGSCPDFRNNEFFKTNFPNIYNDAPACPPLIASRVGYHPYLFTTPPNSNENLPGPNSEQVGINALNLVIDEVNSAYQNGRIKAPDNSKPGLDLDEFAYLSQESDGNLASRGLPEDQRVAYYLAAHDIACKTDEVQRFGPYGFVVQGDDWPGHWQSPLLDRQRNPLGSYNAIKEWTHQNHEDCTIVK